jgi:hypothetical protein
MQQTGAEVRIVTTPSRILTITGACGTQLAQIYTAVTEDDAADPELSGWWASGNMLGPHRFILTLKPDVERHEAHYNRILRVIRRLVPGITII